MENQQNDRTQPGASQTTLASPSLACRIDTDVPPVPMPPGWRYYTLDENGKLIEVAIAALVLVRRWDVDEGGNRTCERPARWCAAVLDQSGMLCLCPADAVAGPTDSVPEMALLRRVRAAKRGR